MSAFTLATMPYRELREIALGAAALLYLQELIEEGALTGGPDIDTGRCHEVVNEADRRGIVFLHDDIVDKALEFAIALSEDDTEAAA